MATWIPEKKISETTTEEVKLPWDVIADPPEIPSKTSQLTNDSGFTANEGTVTSVSVKMNDASKGTVTSSGTIDLGTVLTDPSAFATSEQGTKADNAMPKSGGAFTGNISVPKTITFTDETNPFIKMRTGGTDFYFQSTSGMFGLGPTWNNATHWDSNGNVTFPTVPKVGDSSLALKSEIPTDYVKYTAQTLTDAQKSQARSNIGAGTSNFSGNYNDLSNKPTPAIKSATLTGTTLYLTL